MPNERILIVEDDKHISKLIKYNLEKADFRCSVVITGEEALQFLANEPVDFVVLDIMLPKMDGLEVCKRMRQDPHLLSVPIIFLTAKGEEVDRIVGFELGADDYIVKPFSPRELVLRIKTILKRGKPAKESTKDILSCHNIQVHIPKHRVTIDEKAIDLTHMEFNLLATLIGRQGRVQTREQLLSDVWDMESDVTTRTIDTHVKRLRQKLGKAGKFIETVRGLGYRMNEEE
jgi:DNA-binding response OmpR family regulator